MKENVNKKLYIYRIPESQHLLLRRLDGVGIEGNVIKVSTQRRKGEQRRGLSSVCTIILLKIQRAAKSLPR